MYLVAMEEKEINFLGDKVWIPGEIFNEEELIDHLLNIHKITAPEIPFFELKKLHIQIHGEKSSNTFRLT
jgi:hypothetical protein